MTVLVVYESMYGSTRAVAEAIAEGLAPAGSVRVVEVGALAHAPGGRTITTDVDLMVVGGATHTFGLSRASTRDDATRHADGAIVSHGVGLREWLEELSLPVGGTRFAAFDTKVVRPKLPGSAAKAADKQLRRMGGRPVADPRTFWVKGRTDGLVDGELEAARAWGAALATQPMPR